MGCASMEVVGDGIVGSDSLVTIGPESGHEPGIAIFGSIDGDVSPIADGPTEMEVLPHLYAYTHDGFCPDGSAGHICEMEGCFGAEYVVDKCRSLYLIARIAIAVPCTANDV